MKEYYFDNAATTCICKEALEALINTSSEEYGNASSLHSRGMRAKKILQQSREYVANALDCHTNELFFTSCGTESDNWAILSGAKYNSHCGKHIISSLTEHDAVRKSLERLTQEGFEVTYLKPNKNGAIETAAVLDALRDDTALISLMMVNNETGSITDIPSISKALKEKKSHALIHTDAVQGFMKIPFSARTLGADLISISGHKIHAPKGIGALYIKNGIELPPYIMGGGQEMGLRSGTEPIHQVAAFGAACKAAMDSFEDDIITIENNKEKIINIIKHNIPLATVIGGGAPHIINFSFPGIRSEQMIVVLDSMGICVSKSSACKKGKESHVLKAMDLKDHIIQSSLRISLSRYTTEKEVNILCGGIQYAYSLLSGISITPKEGIT